RLQGDWSSDVCSSDLPRRPDPERPAAPPSFRAEDWKFGFTGSRCDACGTRHLPPQRVCVKCQAVDQMTPERLADVPATVATFTRSEERRVGKEWRAGG